MDLNTLVAFCVLPLITIIGWIIVYFLDKKRDEKNKRKEIRVNYLIEAWRLLESASNREDNKLNKNLEAAVADIQLFGNRKQIELAKELADKLSESGGHAYINSLLSELRTNLREELKLEKVHSKLTHLRMKK
jgi:hypothetical protein